MRFALDCGRARLVVCDFDHAVHTVGEGIYIGGLGGISDEKSRPDLTLIGYIYHANLNKKCAKCKFSFYPVHHENRCPPPPSRTARLPPPAPPSTPNVTPPGLRVPDRRHFSTLEL